MKRHGIVLPGFVATVILTSMMAASQGLGLTRINLPFLLGTIFTPDRKRARVIGFGAHMANGWIFAAIYWAAFQRLGRASWWLGAIMGVVHGSFGLLVALPVLPSFHPRMATEEYGPTPTRQLQPPGFLASNYGTRTPASILAAHVVYGALLGWFSRHRNLC